MDPNTIAEQHAARLAALDPLLPEPRPLGDALFTVQRGESAGAAVATYHESPVGTAARTWEPARRHVLDVRLAGPDRAAVLGDLLDRWPLHPAIPGDTDSAAVVEIPSRDTAAVPALIHRGFVPACVVAVRRAGRQAPPVKADVRIRPATPDDLDVALALNLAVVAYDASFGKVTPREDTAEALRNQLTFLLAAPEPAVWLAERAGRVVGLVHIEMPPLSNWARGYAAAADVGYLACLGVAEDERGGGVGTALAAYAHTVLDQAGVPLTVLHHALPNPLSTPFWYANSYRPLWTMWLRKPVIRAA